MNATNQTEMYNLFALTPDGGDGRLLSSHETHHAAMRAAWEARRDGETGWLQISHDVNGVCRSAEDVGTESDLYFWLRDHGGGTDAKS